MTENTYSNYCDQVCKDCNQNAHCENSTYTPLRLGRLICAALVGIGIGIAILFVISTLFFQPTQEELPTVNNIRAQAVFLRENGVTRNGHLVIYKLGGYSSSTDEEVREKIAQSFPGIQNIVNPITIRTIDPSYYTVFSSFINSHGDIQSFVDSRSQLRLGITPTARNASECILY